MAVVSQAASNIPQTSLYVGDLQPSVTESMLHGKFASIGPVLNARICRDLATRRSLCYAYVNFEDPKDAERALENLNYEQFMGRPIRIMWSQRDPSLRKSGRGNIFIKNLDKTIEQKELYDTFGFFGRILSCKIALDDNGNSRGYGFVHFEKEECAERAIEKINGMLIRDRLVYVGKFIPKTDRKSTQGKLRFNNIYVKNFPSSTTDETLHEMFAKFGEIKSCCVEKDAEGKSKGFGFVCFGEFDDAEQAVKNMHGLEMDEKSLYCNRAQRKEERQEELKQRLEKQRAERQSKYVPGVNLYVKNLDDTIDDDRLKEAFTHYGPITSAKVMSDATGRSKGFGFVCFTQPEQAARAVTEMSGALVGSKPLYVALAQRKEDRRLRLMAEYHQRSITQLRPTMGQLPSAAPHAAASYFLPNAFQQAQRYYHPSSAVINAQPRWNRATGMAGGMPTPMGGAVANRPPMQTHYIGPPNPAAGMTAGQIAAMTQMRTPAGVGRPMMPTGMPGLHTGAHMPGSNMMNQGAAQRQPTGRPNVPMQQVLQQAGMQRPSMAAVVANPNIRPVVSQVPRGVMQPGMGNMSAAAANVRFNQTARNVSTQPGPAPTMQNVLAPLGDQNPLTISTLAQLPESEQKRTLGERLFPLVQDIHPNLAQKLTGMLLSMENSELLHLLESKEALVEKLHEGINVLRENQAVPAVLNEEQGRNQSEQPGQNGDGSEETPKPEGMKAES